MSFRNNTLWMSKPIFFSTLLTFLFQNHMANFRNDMTRYQFSFYLIEPTRMWSWNCFCSFCYVDSIFACFYLNGQLKSILQNFQLAGVVLVVSNPHVFNLTGQLSKPPEFPTLGCDFFRPNTNTQIYKRSLKNWSHRMVSFVYWFFFVVLLARPHKKCANAQMHK